MSDSRDAQYYKAWMTHRTVSRRGLFRGLFNAGHQAQVSVAQQDILRAAGRPPRAVEEALFVRLCHGCGDCVPACPYGLIVLKEGRAAVDIEYADCDFCNKCTDVCSKGALESSIKPNTGLQPTIGLSCLGRMNNYCRQCVIACPEQAINFDPANQVIFDQSLCNGCGKCKLACYHGHISLLPKG